MCLLVAIPSISSCTESNACASVGGVSGVLITFDRSITGRVEDLEACVDGHCRSGHDAAAAHGAFIPSPDVDGPEPVDVTLTGAAANGQLPFAGSTTVTPSPHPAVVTDCGNWWHARVTASRSGLSPTP